MKQNKVFGLIGLIMIFSLILAACAPAATTVAPQPTAAPTTAAPATAVPATAAPKPTAVPATAVPATAAPTFTKLSLAAPDCNYGGALKSIEAPDASTVVFTFCGPNPAFPAQAAYLSEGIQQKATLDATGGDSAKISAKPMGTGPYILKEWVKGDHMTFTANPNWWGGKVTNQTVIFRFSAKSAQRVLELQSGNVDGIEFVGPDDVATVQKDTTLKYYPMTALNTMYLGMNNKKPPFDNETVRQAFAMAIDKARIVKNFFPAGSTVAEQFLYPGLKPGFTDGMVGVVYDQAKAKQMLTDAKFDFNQTILFSYRAAARSYVAYPEQVAQDVQAQLAKIGIKIKLDVQESSTLIGNAGKGNLGFYLLGWGEDYPDATDWFDYHFGPAQLQFGTPYPDIVAAIKTGATTPDAAVRQKAYDEVNKLLLQHVPMVPISHSGQGHAFKASVGNVVVSPYNQNFPFMTTASNQIVWEQSAEPISLNFGDETDGETLNACLMITEALLKFKYGTTETEPALATSFDVNADASVYTFHLRQGVKWSDGTPFTSADVFATYTALWDWKNPNHKGNTGTFEYFAGWLGGINQPPKK